MDGISVQQKIEVMIDIFRKRELNFEIGTAPSREST